MSTIATQTDGVIECNGYHGNPKYLGSLRTMVTMATMADWVPDYNG